MGKVLKTLATVGIAVGIAVLAAPTGGLSIGLAAALGVSVTVASAIVAVGLSLAAGLAMQALVGRPKAGPPQPVNYRNTNANSFIIIGERRQGGVLSFYHPSKLLSDHYRHFIWSAAGHRCDGVAKWFLNDEEVTVNPVTGLVTSGKYANAAWLWFGRGSYDTDETPAGWRASTGGKYTDQHIGYGIAKIYAKFKMTKKVVEAGMPTMTAVIRGTDEVRDPRDGSIGYSNLAIPAFYWWMRLPREEGGFGAAADEMPDDSLLAAWTNICDEDVPTLDGTEKRYAFDSLIECGAPPSQVRDTFVTCCAGSFTYSEGQFLLRPGYWTPPSMTLHEEDLAAGIRVSPMVKAEKVATEVSGTFVDPEALYQPMPVPTRAVASVDVRQMDFDLAHISSHTRGQRILEIMLRRAQCEKTVTWPMNIAGLETRAMQTVQLGTARYGLSNYAFVIDSWGIAADYGVTVGLREENADIYGEPVLKVRSAIATVDQPEDIPTEVDTAASAGEVSDGAVSYTPGQIKSLEDRIAALEAP